MDATLRMILVPQSIQLPADPTHRRRSKCDEERRKRRMQLLREEEESRCYCQLQLLLMMRMMMRRSWRATQWDATLRLETVQASGSAVQQAERVKCDVERAAADNFCCCLLS